MLGRFILIYILLCSPHIVYASWYKQHWNIMGTRVAVEVWHQNKQTAKKAVSSVHDEMQRIDNNMSPFREESELSYINQQAAKHPVKISHELFQLIQKAQSISKISNGTFDITFASVGNLYDYRKHKHPSDKLIKQNISKINFQKIQLNIKNSTIFFKQAGTKIDLGGIAKGYAVDKSIELLKQLGIQHALVSAGGDSRLLGDKKGKPWITGIRHPRHKDKYVAILPLKDTAISTSGDYERFFIEDDIRYHHIIQPKTGKSATASQSVTVLGPDTTTTDAISTTLFILGAPKALNFINSLPDYEAIIIDTHGKLHFSSGLEQPKANKN